MNELPSFVSGLNNTSSFVYYIIYLNSTVIDNESNKIRAQIFRSNLCDVYYFVYIY